MGIGDGANCSISGEKYALEYARRKIGKIVSVVIFDVGAHDGAYTRLVIDVFGKQARIFSFEPAPKIFKQLVENMRNSANVIVENIALGDKEGTATLFIDPDKPQLSSLYNRKLTHFNRTLSRKEIVRMETLDGFSQKNNISMIDFIKLDVEGNEFVCLRGSKLLSERKIKFIQFEFGGSNIDSKSYFQDFWYLFSDAYKIYRILPHGLHEIKKYHEENEIFVTTNYLAELKTK